MGPASRPALDPLHWRALPQRLHHGRPYRPAGRRLTDRLDQGGNVLDARPVVDDEMRTVARQSVGDRTPDTSFGPGNDRDSAGEGQRTPIRGPGHDRDPAFEGVGWQSDDLLDVDLGPDVADLQVGEGALEAAEHRPNDRHERSPVVGHHSCSTPHNSIASASRPRTQTASFVGTRADAEQEAAVVVDEGDEMARPGAAGRADQVERALQVDVPELVDGRPLVEWAGRPDV